MREIEIQKLIIDDLALSHVEQVKERRNRLRIIGAGAAADYNRIAVTAVRGAKRNLREFQDLQNIGIAHLVLQCDAEKIAFPHGTLTFQRKERNLSFAQDAIQIGPRRKDALTVDILAAVEHAV